MMPQEYPFRLISGRHRDRVLARYLASIDLPHLINNIEHPSVEFLEDEEAAFNIIQNPPPPPPLPPTDFLGGASCFRETAFCLDKKSKQKYNGKDERKKFLLTNVFKKEILKENRELGAESAGNRREFIISLLLSSMVKNKGDSNVFQQSVAKN